MPIYVWRSSSGHVLEVFREVNDRNVPPQTEEGAIDNPYQRVFGTVHSTQQEWSRPILSDAMAVNPEDVRAHQIAHPNVPILPDGRIGPITNHHQHLQIQKELGFINRSG